MRTFLILLIFFSVCSCGTSRSEDRIGTFSNLTTDSLLEKHLHAITKAMNMSPISDGVDSFELRIWHGISIVTPNWLVILKYHDSTWSITQTEYWISYEWKGGRPEKASVDSAFIRSFKLPQNISQVVAGIYEFRLDTFPSQHEIVGFQHRVADGDFYQIELATPKYYKALMYSNPIKYQDAYNQKMAKFINSLRIIGVFSFSPHSS